MKWHVTVPGSEVVTVIEAMEPTIDSSGATFERLVSGPTLGSMVPALVAHFRTWVSILKDETEETK